jgi:hypothetical protein
LRIVFVVLFALLILAATLPSTGGIMSGPPRHPDMRRFGPFLFFPKLFYPLVGAVAFSAGCAIIGIVRRNRLETIGWTLLTILLLLAFVS